MTGPPGVSSPPKCKMMRLPPPIVILPPPRGPPPARPRKQESKPDIVQASKTVTIKDIKPTAVVSLQTPDPDTSRDFLPPGEGGVKSDEQNAWFLKNQELLSSFETQLNNQPTHPRIDKDQLEVHPIFSCKTSENVANAENQVSTDLEDPERYQFGIASAIGWFFFLFLIGPAWLLPTLVFFVSLFLSMSTAYWGAARTGMRFLKHMFEANVEIVTEYFRDASSGTPPKTKSIAAKNRFKQEEFARSDLLFDDNEMVVKPTPVGDLRQTQYNYKVRVRVENDTETIAELDSDSHISLITEEYFHHLQSMGSLEVLPEDPIVFEGLGSRIQTKHPPVVLQIQIGKCLLKGRFIVTEHLSSSPILLGTDFTVRNEVSIAPFSSGAWYVHVGPIDNPIGKVRAIVTSKINLCSSANVTFQPMEIKKIQVCYSVSPFEAEFTRNTPCYQSLTPGVGIQKAPFRILDDVTCDESTVSIQNVSLVPALLPEGLEVATAELDLRSFKVKSTKDTVEVSPDDSGEPILDDTSLDELEPGFVSPTWVDKDAELLSIWNSETIPQKHKKKLVDFLLARESLFSGEEFSKETFPEHLYQHDVELSDPIKGLASRPFPVSGIRLTQLKADIAELVRTGVLSPGDSPFTSPVFYVLKKPGEGKTASRGRLCFDYRKVNAHIKMKNFPLTNIKNFFDEASKFKHFCILDIQNAFLSIKLTQRARELLAIITPFGTFLPNRTPYGLRTSPSAFCYALYMILHDLKFVQFYMDDIYIGGNSEEEMIDNLCIVLDRLHKHNLKIRLSKTKFFVKKIKLLGVIYSSTGKQIDPDKISAIQKFGEINTLKKLQCFLGMLAYVSSFIPHFSSVCAPLYALLKSQNVPFRLTKEALAAYDALKEYIGRTTMLYHVNLSKPIYLSTDASNVGAGGFLYQVTAYEKNASGQKKMLADLGFEIEKGAPAYLLPGVSSGKNTPIVTDFVKDKSLVKLHDELNTLDQTQTTTEKVNRIEENYVLNVNPIAFYSKSFSEAQTLRYATMEKEMLAMMWCVQNFRDYIQAAPVTYLLTDSQPICWALRHKDDNVKLSRWLCKLFELDLNLIITHIVGARNTVADFLSRLYVVPEAKTPKDNLGPKMAQHIVTPFPYLSVITPEDVLKGFQADMVMPCDAPELCHLNVNNFIYRNLGPFEPKYTCLDDNPNAKVIKVNKIEGFCFSPDSLNKFLTIESIFEHQQKDEKISRIVKLLENDKPAGLYKVQNGILYKFFENKKRPCVIVLPKSLVMYALASSHFISHAGAEKLYSLIQLKYYWKSMRYDIKEFSSGCILCGIFKSTNQGLTEVGTPRIVTGPGQSWQMDVVSGLPSVKSYKSFLNVIDMYTGFTIPLPLKNETSNEIAGLLENQVIKIFGPPLEISSDNASNLDGPPIKKLAKFFNISLRKTVPYSPTSHSLVENANRYIVQLARIFGDQFQSHWTDVLALAALVFNSIPRPQLQNHSPYYLMFQREIFADNYPSAKNNANLDIDTYLKRSINDRVYVKILRERLLKIREKRNAELSRTYRSYPPQTLISVKDMRPRVHKKIKPVYHKLPQLVLKEYRCTVFAQDIFGRVHKHSKNNIKLASQRSSELFGKLPLDVKFALGDEFDLDRWLEIKDSGIVPAYMLDIQIGNNLGVSTRGRIAEVPTLQTPVPVSDTETTEALDLQGQGEYLEDIVDDLDDDDVVRKLNDLHGAELLTDPGLGLGDIPGLYRAHAELLQDGESRTRNNVPVDPEDLVSAGLDPDRPSTPPPARRRPSFGIDATNILPPKVRRRVRFRLPVTTD